MSGGPDSHPMGRSVPGTLLYKSELGASCILLTTAVQEHLCWCRVTVTVPFSVQTHNQILKGVRGLRAATYRSSLLGALERFVAIQHT